MQQKEIPFPQKSERRYAAKAAERFAIRTPLESNRSVQGGCSDGDRYYYQVFMHREDVTDQENNEVRVAKIDMESGKIVQLSRNLWLHHANDMTYNPKTRKLIVCNNKPHRNWLTVLDPDTLEMERTIELSVEIFGITYNEQRDIYAAGISFGKSFCFLDADFHVIDDKVYPPTPLTDRYVNQGIGSDDDFIYFAFWDAQTLRDDPENFQGTIGTYRWNGEFAGLIDFDIGPIEPENICSHKGKLLMVGCDAGTMRCYELS